MVELSKIDKVLTALSVQASELDKQRGEHHLALFDEQLFQTRSRLLHPCVVESQHIVDSIKREQEQGTLTHERAEYLSEKLISQISAIQRELSTSMIRSQEPKHSSHFRKPIHVLHQDLIQHQEWEARLQQMLQTATLQGQSQQVIEATQQRLNRCRAARIKIENQITDRESHKNEQ
ncbi:primosomal replication protein [Vibrio agarivorans]|uniref:Primosomal replication protein n=1 Tax=Vibrio agarivorans TaxID=153622 RepID=A0ABT7XY72_9VIBR|nr:primosomal replication protein [Vibrio agarivorans]MDN2480727.1 primosomal replication protein [Vibrio agarivorans]